MMKQFILYMGICSLLLGAASCRDESAALPTGSLYLGVEEDATILTRAKTEVTDELLRVDIIDAAGDTLKSYDDYYTEVRGKRIVLPVGSYTVAVRSNLSGGAAWETPFYAGSESVTVQAGEITSAQVVCQITNTKVIVEYAPKLAEYFSKYETTVSNTSGSLLYTRDEYRAGYFAPEKLTAELHLTNLDGNTFTLTRVYPDIQPRYAYKLRYYLDEGDGGEDDSGDAGADFGGIGVDEQADTIYYTISIKEEDLFGKGAPTLTLTGFSDEGKLTFKKTDNPDVPQHAVQISAPNGVKQFRVEVVSHQFADMASFDLCNLTDKEQSQLRALNFPLQPDMTAKEMTLELTEFARALEPASETVMGTHSFTFTLLDSLHQETTCTFGYDVRPNVAVTTDEPDAWAKFVTLKGNSAAPTNAGFMLRKAGDADYQRYDATSYDASTGDFSLLLTEGIEPETEYEYYAVSGTDDAGEVRRFKTDGTPTVPNLSFDDWCESDGVLYPNYDLTSANYFWDSGNTGAKIADKTPTDSTSSNAVKGKAAYLHSVMATFIGIGKFAAGNIYTGKFVQVIYSPMGAELDFGRPYDGGRPTKLTGYYKYQPVAVSEGGHNELEQGDMDKCSIYIALCDWTEPFRVNTGSSKFVDLNSPDIIAYGELSDAEASQTDMQEYKRFEIDIKYRDLTRKPTYILIVASASKYGDYFTGGEGSTLYVDEFELSFDYNAASFNE